MTGRDPIEAMATAIALAVGALMLLAAVAACLWAVCGIADMVAYLRVM